MWQAIYSVA